MTADVLGVEIRYKALPHYCTAAELNFDGGRLLCRPYLVRLTWTLDYTRNSLSMKARLALQNVPYCVGSDRAVQN